MKSLLQRKAIGLEFCTHICACNGFRNDAAEGLDKTSYLGRLKLIALIQTGSWHRARVSKARDCIKSWPPNQACLGRNFVSCFFFRRNGRGPEVFGEGYPVIS